jgi:UPF0716 family protein affecting phage T7 exclusion
MTALLRRVVRWVAAIVLIVVGLVLAIPGVPGPGLLVILLGILLLLPESRWLRKKYARFKRRYPAVFAPMERRWRRKRQRPAQR